MAVSLGTTYVDIVARIDQFEKNILKASEKLGKFGRDAQRMGKSLSTKVTAPVAALGLASIKTFADFEQSMLKVKAISGATGKQFSMLEDDSKRLGSTTRYTASQVAALQLGLSKLGFTPDEIIQSTESVLRLAQATDEDLADSARVAAGTLRAFEMDASNMPVVVDTMAKSFSSSALTLEKWQYAMASVAPVASAYGMTLQETAAIVATLVDRNIDASTAGTALRNIILDTAREGIDLNDALVNIRNSVDPLTTAFDYFGKRGANVATVIANNTDQIYELTDVLFAAQGSAAAMAEIMDSGLVGAFYRLKSIIEGAMISLKDVLGPSIKNIVQWLGEWINKFKDLDEKTQTTIVVIALVAAAIGPLLIAAGMLAASISALVGFFAAFGVIMLKVAVVVAVGVAAYRVFTLLLEKAWALGEKIGDGLVWLINLYNDFWDAIGRVSDELKNSFLGALQSVWEYIKSKMVSAIEELYNKISKLWEFFSKVADKVGGFVASATSVFSIEGRAVGGPVSANTPYIVGEEGPELMIPSSSGTIIPNHKMGGQQVINMNFAAGTDMETVSALKNMKQMIADVAIEAVTEHNLRNAY